MRLTFQILLAVVQHDSFVVENVSEKILSNHIIGLNLELKIFLPRQSHRPDTCCGSKDSSHMSSCRV